MTTLETAVTKPRPHLAEGQERLVATYDVRFAAVREKLVRICAGVVGSDAAEDVVHDAYVRGRTRFAQLRDIDLFEAWLTRLALNLCATRRQREGLLRGLLSSLREPARVATRDAGLRELIERLPPRERTLVVLHYGYGYQLDEIGRMAGLSPGNVRSIVFRARRRLGAQIERGD